MLPVYPGFVFKEFLAALLCLLILAWLGLIVEAPLDVAADPALPLAHRPHIRCGPGIFDLRGGGRFLPFVLVCTANRAA